MNERVYSSLIMFVILSILIAVRFFVNIGDQFISGINFIGFSVAIISMLFSIKQVLRKRNKYIWTMITIIVLIICIIIAVLVFLGIICVNEKWDDIITLGALWGTLPVPFYVAIFNPDNRVRRKSNTNS